MIPALTVSPPCPTCGTIMLVTLRVRHFRRGRRVIVVNSGAWTCTCGAEPFVPRSLAAWEEERAQETWTARYGVSMPPSAQGHRVSEERVVRVPILLTREEAARLDVARGPLSRGEYLRQSLTVGSPS